MTVGSDVVFFSEMAVQEGHQRTKGWSAWDQPLAVGVVESYLALPSIALW